MKKRTGQGRYHLLELRELLDGVNAERHGAKLAEQPLVQLLHHRIAFVLGRLLHVTITISSSLAKA